MLVVGFYCSGMDGDFVCIVVNLYWLEVVVFVVYCCGYVLMIGEWLLLLFVVVVGLM